jgi:hypothetical protein
MTAMGRKGGFSAEKVLHFQGQYYLLEFGLRTREGEGGGVYQSQTFASQFRHAANGPSGRAHMLTVHS